ncbi:TIGR02466 family protein [Catellatospora sp. NPDC049133]|uniref:TIGR02466 family protein n=1 Tax=Catellatospora sp. NPDC049133 TaxID=3155499 RepID=UPI0033CEE9EB
MRGSVLENWATEVYVDHVADGDLTDGLAAAILEREKHDNARSLGIVHGRKSAADLLRWGTPHTDALTARISAMIETVAAEPARRAESLEAHAWAVVYRPGGSHELHSHHDCAWSGVFYVQASAEPEHGGAIELFDSRQAMLARHAQTEDPVLRIQPRPGLLIAFPSWVQHRVTPVSGGELRICVAFNVSFQQGARP